MDYITGSSGFLGTNLCKVLQGLRKIPHQDIGKTNIKDCKNFYFLSAYGNMHFHTEDSKIVKANVSDLIHILKQIDWIKLNSFIFISTSSVKRKTHTMYSRTKRAAEELLLSFMEKYNAPISILRPLSITGVGEQKKHLIPTLINCALTGRQMPFVPNATHDYIDVSDVVSAIMLLSERRMKGIFEAGNGVAVTNQEVRELVEAETGKKIKVKLVSNMRSYDSSEWVSTNFRLRQLGWKPKKTLKQIIKEMVNDSKRR